MAKIHRRTLLRGGAVLVGAVSGARILPTSKARAQGAAANPVPAVRALFFDVFGTERFAALSNRECCV